MGSTIIVGGFFGDEWKGKIVAHMAFADKPTIIARGGIGPNAGHTIEVRGQKFGVRMIPSGFVYANARLLIGAGVLVDPRVLLSEIELVGEAKRVGVDHRCAILEQKKKTSAKEIPTFRVRLGQPGLDADRLRPIEQEERQSKPVKCKSLSRS